MMGLRICIFICLASLARALSPTTFLNADDFKRLEDLFQGHLSSKKDVQSVHFAALGAKQIGIQPTNVQDVCKFLKSKVDNDVASLFFVAKAAEALPGCKLTIPAETVQSLHTAASNKPTVVEIYHAVGALVALGEKVNSKSVSAALSAALKKDDSVLSLGYAFHVASELEGELTAFLDRVEDAAVQADEVDDQYLQYEGGVGITSTILTGAYRLAEKANKRPAITDDQASKFANYLANRKSIQSIKGAFHLVNALTMFCSNKFHLPAVVTLASPAALTSARPRVTVRLTDLLGRPLAGELTLTADSATRLQDDAVVVSRSPFTPSKSDRSLYELDLVSSAPGRGFYQLVVSAKAAKPDGRLIGHSGAKLRVKVMTQVSVENVELGVADADQTTAARINKIVQHSKLGTVLDADSQQKLLLKFTVLDKQTKKPMRCHQAFVRLANKETGKEVLYVAEPDSQLTYKFDMSVSSQAKKFGSASGVYAMELLLGDAVIENAISWTMADVSLQFADAPAEPKADPYQPKPEIKHEFRAPEPRPPVFISSVFTGLVCAPLLVMLVLWLRIGANIAQFPISLAGIGFLAGIGGIFGLYYLFWVQLTMFATVKYLFGLGVVTFLCGHSTLSKLASKRKQKA